MYPLCTSGAAPAPTERKGVIRDGRIRPPFHAAPPGRALPLTLTLTLTRHP
jgi:hypothetical protein